MNQTNTRTNKGFVDGYEGRFPRERDKQYLLDYAMGRERKASEHVEGKPSFIWATENMIKSEDTRRFKSL